MTATQLDALRKSSTRQWKEGSIHGVLMTSALLSILTTVGVVAVLAAESSTFFREVSPVEFLTGTKWTPLFDPPSHGVLPLLCGTGLIAVGSGILALPIGLAIAVYLSEMANRRRRRIVKPMLEVLAGIPTVVYGYFALTFVTPCLRWLIPSTEVFNAAAGAIVVAIMILPMVASLCDDSLQAVPASLRQAAYSLGATPREVSVGIVVPGALSGILASFVLALSRAIGETMAVTLAAGATPRLTLNPLESIQTMTAFMAQVSSGDAPSGTSQYNSIFAVGFLLFAITLFMNWLAQRVLHRFREAYE